MASLPTLFYEAASSRGLSNFGLPADLLERARARIRIVALLLLFASGVDVLIAAGQRSAVALGYAREIELISAIPFAGSMVVFIACATVVGLSRSSRISNIHLLRAGLGLEVLLCATISVTNPIAFYQERGALPNLTWVTPLIILFPLIVPFPPRATLVTALLSAATTPLGLWILDSVGEIECRSDDYFATSFGPAMAVAIAYFGSRVVHGLGLQVAAARRMGSYRLERLLGKGGMGEVWLARHRFLARPAAVKLIRPEILGSIRSSEPSSVRDRFEREAQATASMRSPHTIGLYDYGVTEAGDLYYVMELLDGYDLELLVERFGPLPASRTIHLLVQVCHSLAEAHEAGLIHRDIKPANLYVCRYGREVDFVKVLDFGLAKAGQPDEMATLTAEHAIAGTAAYLAPEQALGHAADARSDIYALGCVAYWMLTGDLVFQGSTPVELLVQHAKSSPIPPSARSEGPIPISLDRLVMQCIAKDPAHRPQSALELTKALSGCKTEDSWTEERARSWWRTHQPSPVISAPGSLETEQAIDG